MYFNLIGQHIGFMSANILWQIPLFLCVKVKKYIRMGIIIFKIFIWEGMLLYIRFEIMFYGSADVLQ